MTASTIVTIILQVLTFCILIFFFFSCLSYEHFDSFYRIFLIHYTTAATSYDSSYLASNKYLLSFPLNILLFKTIDKNLSRFYTVKKFKAVCSI